MRDPHGTANWERALRRANLAMWTLALQRRRLRSKEREDEEFIFRKLADFDFLIVALSRLRRAALLAATVPAIKDDIRRAIMNLDNALPMLQKMRNVLEHFDDYSIGKGRERDVRRGSLEVGSFGDEEFQWLDHQLNVDVALTAATLLYEAIRDAKSEALA